jgi:hypothetical protein
MSLNNVPKCTNCVSNTNVKCLKNNKKYIGLKKYFCSKCHKFFLINQTFIQQSNQQKQPN